jgi:hypothetical protein
MKRRNVYIKIRPVTYKKTCFQKNSLFPFKNYYNKKKWRYYKESVKPGDFLDDGGSRIVRNVRTCLSEDTPSHIRSFTLSKRAPTLKGYWLLEKSKQYIAWPYFIARLSEDKMWRVKCVINRPYWRATYGKIVSANGIGCTDIKVCMGYGFCVKEIIQLY